MAGPGTGIWVSIGQQEVFLIENKQIVKRYRCSTAANGAGNKKDSGKTPLGWHRIGAKIGDELTMGAILKDREWTGQVWKGEDTDKDLILSRILWLEGLEEGINRGGNVDSYGRYIYIHGTNAIDDLGRPTSAGCIRLDPREVIDLYERAETGTRVLITKN
jgi:UDP-N-acetylmuramate--alanine ligase